MCRNIYSNAEDNDDEDSNDDNSLPSLKPRRILYSSDEDSSYDGSFHSSLPSLASCHTTHSSDEDSLDDDDDDVDEHMEFTGHHQYNNHVYEYKPSSTSWIKTLHLPYMEPLSPPSCGTPPPCSESDAFQSQDSDKESLVSFAAQIALSYLLPPPIITPCQERLNVFLSDLQPVEYLPDDDDDYVDPLVNVSQAETVNTDSTSFDSDESVFVDVSGPSNMVLQAERLPDNPASVVLHNPSVPPGRPANQYNVSPPQR